MGWGNKLVVAFVAFAALICTLVYKAVTTRYDLVTPEYYQDELKYEDHINAVNNASKLSDVHVQQDGSTFTITLPQEMNGYAVKGKAWFYCKTNADKDKQQLFTTNNGIATFSKAALPTGNLLLKLSWQSGTIEYYVEKNIQL